MSKALSLKINEDIYKEVEEITKKYHIPRNAYINQALSIYNKLNRYMRGKFFLNGTVFSARTPHNGTSNYLPRFTTLLVDSKLFFSLGSVVFKVEGDTVVEVKQFSNYIIALYRDPHAGLWIGLSKGGVYYFPDGDVKGRYYHFLEENSVSGILVDHAEGLWLTTHEKGIYYSPFINCWQYNRIPGFSCKMAGLHTFKNKLYVANYKSEIFTVNENGGSTSA